MRYEKRRDNQQAGSQVQKAASAVFTIISKDPSNTIMKHNFKLYVSMPEVDVKKIANYEAEEYVSLYHAGTEAYYLENYETAVKKFEASTVEFFRAIDECRADCEGPFDQGWLPDFTSSVANHFVYCLKCKHKCHSQLIHLNGEMYEDFLPLHYNFLQFAYYKTGKLKEACAAAATYLKFFPADETMLENVKFYKSLPRVEASMFQPRSEAVDYIKRMTYEEALLKYIADEFVFEDKDEQNQFTLSDEIHEEQSLDPLQYPPEGHKFDASLNITLIRVSSPGSKAEQELSNSPLVGKQIIKKESNQDTIILNDKSSKREKSLLEHDMLNHFTTLKTSVRKLIFNYRGENALGGEKRFVVDGLANERECQLMIWFAKATGVRGDGYDGNKSPHSPLEKFEGVTVGRAALMVYFNLIELFTLHLFLDLSERGKNVVAAYFNISSTDLHFSYTHLVCRSALPGEPINSYPLSHEIHADNCGLLRDGRCARAYPAYYWRDYSAIMYLNDDFEGGEFLFSADPSGKFIQSSIEPACGRLVGFSAGKENLHGVRGVKRGSRCALALWFTLDSTRAEWGRTLTEEVVQHLESGECPRKSILEDLQNLVQFNLQEAQTQMLQTASCSDCAQGRSHFPIQQREDKRKSFPVTKSNVTTY